MSEDSMKKGSSKSPHTVDSTNSSVVVNDSSFSSPENGSTIITNGDDKFLAETLQTYIDELKFDTSAQEDAVVKKESSLVVEEFLGRNKNPGAVNKRGKPGNANNSAKSKSKVTFSSSKGSSAFLDQNLLKSQQQLATREAGKSKTKSSTNTVIREWGKRPLLVESDPPWTPRNRMYQNALKAVARARQLNPETNSVMLPPFTQRNMGSANAPPIEYAANYGGGNQQMYLPNLPANNAPQYFSYGPPASPPVGPQQPVLTGISPMPVGVDMNNMPLAVSIEPSSNSYTYSHPGMVLQQQPNQSVVYGQTNSQGVWVPLTGQQPQLQLQNRQSKP